VAVVVPRLLPLPRLGHAKEECAADTHQLTGIRPRWHVGHPQPQPRLQRWMSHPLLLPRRLLLGGHGHA
jgi:hypothetical protein